MFEKFYGIAKSLCKSGTHFRQDSLDTIYLNGRSIREHLELFGLSKAFVRRLQLSLNALERFAYHSDPIDPKDDRISIAVQAALTFMAVQTEKSAQRPNDDELTACLLYIVFCAYWSSTDVKSTSFAPIISKLQLSGKPQNILKSLWLGLMRMETGHPPYLRCPDNQRVCEFAVELENPLYSRLPRLQSCQPVRKFTSELLTCSVDFIEKRMRLVLSKTHKSSKCPASITVERCLMPMADVAHLIYGKASAKQKEMLLKEGRLLQLLRLHRVIKREVFMIDPLSNCDRANGSALTRAVELDAKWLKHFLRFRKNSALAVDTQAIGFDCILCHNLDYKGDKRVTLEIFDRFIVFEGIPKTFTDMVAHAVKFIRRDVANNPSLLPFYLMRSAASDKDSVALFIPAKLLTLHESAWPESVFSSGCVIRPCDYLSASQKNSLQSAVISRTRFNDTSEEGYVFALYDRTDLETANEIESLSRRVHPTPDSRDRKRLHQLLNFRHLTRILREKAFAQLLEANDLQTDLSVKRRAFRTYAQRRILLSRSDMELVERHAVASRRDVATALELVELMLAHPEAHSRLKACRTKSGRGNAPLPSKQNKKTTSTASKTNGAKTADQAYLRSAISLLMHELSDAPNS